MRTGSYGRGDISDAARFFGIDPERFLDLCESGRVARIFEETRVRLEGLRNRLRLHPTDTSFHPQLAAAAEEYERLFPIRYPAPPGVIMVECPGRKHQVLGQVCDWCEGSRLVNREVRSAIQRLEPTT